MKSLKYLCILTAILQNQIFIGHLMKIYPQRLETCGRQLSESVNSTSVDPANHGWKTFGKSLCICIEHVRDFFFPFSH